MRPETKAVGTSGQRDRGAEKNRERERRDRKTERGKIGGVPDCIMHYVYWKFRAIGCITGFQCSANSRIDFKLPGSFA